MADLRRVYIDSCCFIDMVKSTVGKQVAADREHDVWHLKMLLEANRDREVEIFTSTLTIAECIHVGDPDISDSVKSAFASLLTSGQYVRLVQVSPFIGEDARDLRWKHGVTLRGADGIHVASALDRKCEELLTANGRLQRLSDHADALIKLGLRVGPRRTTQCLPDKYRQLGLVDHQKVQRSAATGTGLH
jgi:PIN domain